MPLYYAEKTYQNLPSQQNSSCQREWNLMETIHVLLNIYGSIGELLSFVEVYVNYAQQDIVFEILIWISQVPEIKLKQKVT